jgi:peroxiredoxin
LSLSTVPARGLVHLQFRRFAGCPICNLHLQSFVRGHERLVAAGVTTVALFHSPASEMLPYQVALPFPVVADGEHAWYNRFGVERSVFALLHPSAMAAAITGMASAPFHPRKNDGGVNGLPADFLIDARGVVVAAKYGEHANDQWSVDDVVALAAGVLSAASSS